MFCTNCGGEIASGINFCSNCGQETAHGAEMRRAATASGAGSGSPRRLTRHAHDRQIGGVCAGLAQYMGADPTVVRLIAVAILVISCGAAILAYLAAWIIMPVDYSGVPNPAPSAGNWA